MSTIDEMIERKSIRAFKDTKISEQDKEKIFLSAVNAPSPGNQQMYRIIDVIDESLKEQLSVLCDNQPFMAKAPLMLVFCADFRKWIDAFETANCTHREIGYGDMVLAIEDAMIAAQNTVCAAHSLGLGSCYIGDILENKEKVCELLKLPKYVLPATLIVYGYPKDDQLKRIKPKRESLDHLVCKDYYHVSSGEELKEMFKEKQELKSDEEYNDWMSKFCNRKFNSDFSKEMTRSLREYFKDYEGV